MNIEPLVSIVITTHKGSDSVSNAIRSVYIQDYPAVEVIVVDDNGLGTEEQIKTEKAISDYFGREDFCYIPHEKNRNGSAARNTGWRQAKGKYIGFLDDDDIYLPEKLKKSVTYLEKNAKYGAVYTNSITVYTDGMLKRFSSAKGKLLFSVLVDDVFMNPGTLLIRKEIVDKLNGFDESFMRHQDLEFNTRMAAECLIGHLNIYGSLYNCKVRRNRNAALAVQYRTHYMTKMMPILDRMTPTQKNCVLFKNAMDLSGDDFLEAKKLAQQWGADNINFGVVVNAKRICLLQKVRYKLGRMMGGQR